MQSSRRRALRAIIVKLHRLQNDVWGEKYLALEIQEELLCRITRAERVIQSKRAQVKQLKNELKARNHDRQKVLVIRSAMADQEKIVLSEKGWIVTLKSIGDGIAFIYADRFDLKNFAFHPAPGFITGKRGARLERSILRHTFHLGLVAVLHDLTHTLRHADLTVFHPNRPPMMIEAKSGRGGNFARLQRQMEAMTKISDYLRTDELIEEHGIRRRVEAHNDIVDHGSKVTRLAASLEPGSSIIEEVEPGLHYWLTDWYCPNSSIESTMREFTGRRIMFFQVNQMKQVHQGYLPFVLTLVDADVATRFYAGELFITIILDLDLVTEIMRKNGLDFSVIEDSATFWTVRPLEKPGATNEGLSYIPYHPIGRIAAEFVTLDWLLKSIIHLHRSTTQLYDDIKASPPSIDVMRKIFGL